MTTQREYRPMADTFPCKRCNSRQPTYGAEYVAKEGDPLHQERVCAMCIERAANKTTEGIPA
jgi:hypothetical protein